jgi:hypothetical protein
MHAKTVIQKILFPVIHKSRAKALSKVVMAGAVSKRLTLSSLGREIDSLIQDRSGIQKVNRLLGNERLLNDYSKIAKSVSDLLIGNKKHPKIIVDWTKYPNSEDVVLCAMLAVESGALVLYEKRCSVKKMGNKQIQQKFLRELKTIIPSGCKPVIVTDAGFHNDWFKKVLKLGWDYVGRIRGMRKYREPGKNRFISCRNLFKHATKKARRLGELILTRKNPTKSHFYLIKEELSGRKARTRGGKVRRDKDSKAYSRSHREPWLLASSLSGFHAAKKVVRIYSSRMKIEESFRNLKSSRYGLSLEQSKTIRKKRRDILLLIAMLANIVAWVMGCVGEKMKIQCQFQSNSIKHRRVISIFSLGYRMIKKRITVPISMLRNAIASLHQEAIHE